MWKERFYSSYLSEVFGKLGKELFKGSKISPEFHLDPPSKFSRNSPLIEFSNSVIINGNKDFEFSPKHNDTQPQNDLITLDIDSDSNHLSNPKGPFHQL